MGRGTREENGRELTIQREQTQWTFISHEQLSLCLSLSIFCSMRSSVLLRNDGCPSHSIPNEINCSQENFQKASRRFSVHRLLQPRTGNVHGGDDHPPQLQGWSGVHHNCSVDFLLVVVENIVTWVWSEGGVDRRLRTFPVETEKEREGKAKRSLSNVVNFGQLSVLLYTLQRLVFFNSLFCTQIVNGFVLWLFIFPTQMNGLTVGDNVECGKMDSLLWTVEFREQCTHERAGLVGVSTTRPTWSVSRFEGAWTKFSPANVVVKALTRGISLISSPSL